LELFERTPILNLFGHVSETVSSWKYYRVPYYIIFKTKNFVQVGNVELLPAQIRAALQKGKHGS
jgi:hypothetical protein